MAKLCPKCNCISLDYDPNFKKWICVWEDCLYEEDDKNTIEYFLEDIEREKGNIIYYIQSTFKDLKERWKKENE